MERGALVGGLSLLSFFGLVLLGRGYFFMILHFGIFYFFFANPDPFVITYWFSLVWQVEGDTRVTEQNIFQQDLVQISHLVYEEAIFVIQKDIYRF